MGAKQWKDPGIALWAQIDKQYYFAGETVSGFVYLRVIKGQRYQNLKLKIQGKQYLQFPFKNGEYIGKNTYAPCMQISYHFFSDLKLAQFDKKIPKGDYIFPFIFRLPKSIAGSFHYSMNAHIHHYLVVTMENSKGENMNQIYKLPMNIIQIPMAQTPYLEDEEDAELTGCFCTSYGTVEAKIFAFKNIIYPEEPFEVEFQINNVNGNNVVKAAKIYFERRFFRGTHRSQVEQRNLGKILVHRTQERINPGEEKKFKAQIIVPEKFNVPTVIGNYMSNYYILKLELQYEKFTFFSKPCPRIHVFFHPRNPIIRQAQKFPALQNWHPQIQPILQPDFQMRGSTPKPVKEMPYKYIQDKSDDSIEKYKYRFQEHLKSPLLNTSPPKTPGDTSRELSERREFKDQL